MDTIRVNVAGTIHTYPLAAAAYGDHVASNDSTVYDLTSFTKHTKRVLRRTGNFAAKSITGFVALDDSGLVYHIEMRRSGSYKILGAAPMDGRIEQTYRA